MNLHEESSIITKPAEGATEDQELLNKVTAWLQEAEGADSETLFRTEGEEDEKFYSGDQDTPEVKQKLIDDSRPDSTFNEILPKINMIVGIAGQANKSPYVFPITSEDDALTECINGAVKHYRRKLLMFDKEIDCFDSAIKRGRAFLHFYISDENPFKPVICCKIIRGDMVWLDPSSTEYDLSDARFIIADEWFSKDVMLTRFGVSEEGLNLMAQSSESGVNFYDITKDMYRVSQCWYYKYEKAYWYRMNAGDTPRRAWKEEWQKLSDMYESQGISVDVREKINKRLYYVTFSGGVVIEKGPGPYVHNKLPYILFGAYHSEFDNRWFSVISMMKDPQRSLNTMYRQLVHLLQTLPKGILVHEVGAVLNIEEYETSSAKPNFHLEVARGQLNAIKFEKQPSISPLYEQLAAIFSQLVKNCSGIQDTLMGKQTSSREPGVTVRMRQETGIAVLYTLFRNLRRSRLDAAKMLVSLIQQYVTEQEIVRIEGQEGAQLLTINSQRNPDLEGFNDITAEEYDLDYDEISDNSTMRQNICDMLIDFAHNNPNSIPPDLILEYSDLPLSAKTRVQKYHQQMLDREDRKFAVEQAVMLNKLNQGGKNAE